MKNKFYLLIFFTLILVTFSSLKSRAKSVHQWEVYTLIFKSSNEYKNPYIQIPANKINDLIHVEFEGISGDAKGKVLTIIGFWAGESEWHVNFASPFTGAWKYKSFSDDENLDAKEGSFEVIPWTSEEKEINPTRHGFIKVRKEGPNAGHYFEYADGTSFLWLGDTWWDWTKRDIYFESFKKLVDDRAAKGFNIGQLFVPGNSWNKEYGLLDTTYTRLDVQNMNKVEEMIRYANSKGITMWIHGWWGGENLDKTIGKENMERWWRYLVHRFAAYNVIWVVAGEYNLYNYGNLTLAGWKEIGALIKSEDPYDRITSIHNTPPFWFGGKDAPQWSTSEVLQNESWMDYNQCQVGHGKCPNEMIPYIVSKDYALSNPEPIVVTEPWYEFLGRDISSSDIRFGAWSAILSGAAGHSYGGGNIWFAGVPETKMSHEDEVIKQNGLTLDYPGAQSLSYLMSFFSKINWNNLTPHPELVLDYPQPFCLANPGKEYIIYLRYGGNARIFLGKNAVNKSIEYYWYDPASGQKISKDKINGAEYLWFNAPNPENLSNPENKDWALYIRISD